MQTLTARYLFVFSIIFSSLIIAEEDIDSEINKGLESKSLEVTGVIADRTVTRLGRDFYSFFSRKVYEQMNSVDQNLLVEEKPTALSGSIITVYHLSTPIYRTALSPGLKQAEDKSEEAVRVLQQYELQWELEKKYRDKSDLADSELDY